VQMQLRLGQPAQEIGGGLSHLSSLISEAHSKKNRSDLVDRSGSCKPANELEPVVR
jgi:hypothetical protein